VLVERDFGKEGADLGQHLVVRLTQSGGVAQRVEVGHQAPGFIQLTGAFIETEHDGVKVHQLAAILIDEGIQTGLCLFKSGADVGFDVFGGQGGPADVKVLGEKRCCHGWGFFFADVGDAEYGANEGGCK
jgi:hypothetical protein